MAFGWLFSGLRRLFKKREPIAGIIEITFNDEVPIRYALYPDNSEPYIVIPDNIKIGADYPREPNVIEQPDPGKPHWQWDDLFSRTEFSWPVIYIRKDGNGGAADKEIDAKVRLNAPFTGEIELRADCFQLRDDGVNYDKIMEIAPATIDFNHETEKTGTLKFDGVPDKVRYLNRLELRWQYKTRSMAAFRSANITEHCLFLVDAEPLTPDKYPADDIHYILFDVFDWSCEWADGMAGHDQVLTALWSKFHPVSDSGGPLVTRIGLYYWKNHQLCDPAQDLPEALWGKTDPDPIRKGAACCIVFDRIFMGCLAVQGINSREYKIVVKEGNPPVWFERGGPYFKCGSWVGKSKWGQGNKNAPAGWESHWIALAKMPAGNWMIYDPSYGEGGTIDCLNAGPVDVGNGIKSYETLYVANYPAVNKLGGDVILLPDPAKKPHLMGTELESLS